MTTKKVLTSAEWIWHGGEYGDDDYAEFTDVFVWNGEEAAAVISARGDYTLFVNGKYAASNQYADFEHYKVYDEIDITDFLDKGENRISIVGWYWNKSGMRWYTPNPGIIYEIISGGEILGASSEKTPSRRSKAFLSGRKQMITPQLGYTFCYNACNEDDFIKGGGTDFGKSRVLSGSKELYKRPIKKHKLLQPINGHIRKINGGYIVDYGRETAGLCSFSLVSDKKQNINVSFGEVLEDGHVKKIIGVRNFSFDYTAKAGENEYTNYMLRCGCRYMEIECGETVTPKYFRIIPTEYEVTEKPNVLADKLDRKIYEICLNTLKLCMMEHYVDCPWREQCLYAFDSRNQMLAGYYAFADGNFDYARANLQLIGKDNREDGLLSICCPSGEDMTIPSFSLYYLISVKEYTEYSKDITLANEVFEKLETILNAFYANVKNDTVYKFGGKNHWNFYDWTEYCDGSVKSKECDTDFIINALFVIALQAFDEICTMTNRKNKYAGVAEKIKSAARTKFLNPEDGLFYVSGFSERPTELANSLAVLSGISDESERIGEKLADGSLLPCSLSMKTFKYDALLKTDEEKYKKTVLDEIRNTYKIMIDDGADTVWEVIDGAKAFGNAGSLCHGWSAIPIYYYGILS